MALRERKTAWLSVLLLLGSSIFGLAIAQDNDESSESVLHSEFGRLNNQSLLWGPYRPNLYFGVRPRIPKSLTAGLMWAKVDNYVDVQNNFRYTCEQHEGMAGYGWDEYDTRKGGIQTIHDAGNHIDITTNFVKVDGGGQGGSWAVRVAGVPREGAPENLKTTVILYVTTEDEGNVMEVVDDGEANGFEGDVTLKGRSEKLGYYKLVISKGTGDHPTSNHAASNTRDLDKTTVHSLTIPPEWHWQSKQVVFKQLKEGIDEIIDEYGPDNAPPPWQVYKLTNKLDVGNVQIIQKVFEGAFEFDVLYSSAAASKDVTSQDLTREIKSASESFNERFSDVFDLQAPFKAEKYQKFGRSMLSNLAGGIGYFYGNQIVDRSNDPAYEEENEGFWEDTAEARARHREKPEGPHELYSSIPSRPFFPRGFLWDEGFHLIPIADWDMDLALEIVKSWYNLMDEDGWIGREQILGDEARSKVPAEFQVQYPHYANPPTLFFIIDNLLDKLQKSNGSQTAPKESLSQQGMTLGNTYIDNPSLGLEYLRNLYPLLRRQWKWFKLTQAGDISSYDRHSQATQEGYRWRGRTPQHILTSGLDDYPRAKFPHPGELHVDLLSWMGMMAKSLARVAEAIGMPEHASEYEKSLEGIENNLVDLHWSEKESCFCDATIDAFEENYLVCHKGYISLFPFLTGLLKADDPRLGKTLDLLGDQDELFSPFGLRSLSKKSHLYGTDENYWRSPVWININYMAIVQLYNVASQDGPYKEKARDLYTTLRTNIVETVYKSWDESGFAWEQYNPQSGQGQRTQHFTGWTSLVVKIMAMPDLAGGRSQGHDEL